MPVGAAIFLVLWISFGGTLLAYIIWDGIILENRRRMQQALRRPAYNMTYHTLGQYERTEEGYLIGYKVIKEDFCSFYDSEFKYEAGTIAGAEPKLVLQQKDNLVTKKSLFGKPRKIWETKEEAVPVVHQLHHCATKDELRAHWANGRTLDQWGRITPNRLVRLIIHPNDMWRPGCAKKAYVESISPPFREWEKFEEEESLNFGEIPPIEEFAKVMEARLLTAGTSVDQVIEQVPEKVVVENRRGIFNS